MHYHLTKFISSSMSSLLFSRPRGLTSSHRTSIISSHQYYAWYLLTRSVESFFLPNCCVTRPCYDEKIFISSASAKSLKTNQYQIIQKILIHQYTIPFTVPFKTWKTNLLTLSLAQALFQAIDQSSLDQSALKKSAVSCM